MKDFQILLLLLLFPFFIELQAQNAAPPTSRPDSHAPIGVMGEHLHKTGEWMLSYRYMRMHMEDNRIGTDQISTEDIATTIPNRFAGMPMQPPTLRVVPTDMNMDMHMVGVMYAPSDWITLMAMGIILRKEMTHLTYQGGMGSTLLGSFITQSNGLGDTKLSALVKLWAKGNHRLHLNAGFSIPTGSITKKDEILTPLETRPTPRLPYPMQLGSGTLDILPGVTYAGYAGNIGWGGQLIGTVRLGDNDEGYSFGNAFQFTAWGSYKCASWISASASVTGTTLGSIDGIDPQIVAPVQTADPDNQGGEWLNVSVGANLIGQNGFIRNHRLGIEFEIPAFQDLNGPQLEVDYALTIGWQYAF